MTIKLIAAIASAHQAWINCGKNGNGEWLEKHRERIEALCREHLPSGSGIDAGSHLDFVKSEPNKLVFHTSFHHMNQNGFYEGWTEHDIVVTPDLTCSCNIRVTGRNRNDIKDYLIDVFHCAFDLEVPTGAEEVRKLEAAVG